ncbi:MAG: hypothetical protein GEU96_10350 [Propionibacteriales bacterium]|nr:hypothetical protein [Propionibacteriales bacterium]
MALEDLLTALEDQGAWELEQAQAESNRLAAQIIADARALAADRWADGVATAESAARQQADDLLTTARTTARRALRTARRQAAMDLLADSHQRLRELPGTLRGAAAVAMCFEEALAALPRATRVHVHPADATTVAALLPTGVGPELIADLGSGGVLVEDDEGRYIDNTYATRLANAWPELRGDLVSQWGPTP